jgi:hypothetical protein
VKIPIFLLVKYLLVYAPTTIGLPSIKVVFIWREASELMLLNQLIKLIKSILSFANAQALVHTSVNDDAPKAGI